MAADGGEDADSYPLHLCVYENDLKRLSSLIRERDHDINGRDIHGNTPLHLATMLGHKECANLLLAKGAVVKVKNVLGWSPLAEAISYGDRQTIALLLRKLKTQSKEQMKARKPEMIAALKNLGDYIIDLKWDFTSWVPLVSKILPSDICKISKKGTLIDVT